jgi:threonine synthase
MDWELIANRNGHIACTQGGESLAGLVTAVSQGLVDRNATAVVDSTAHALKFSGFQDMYFENRFSDDYHITPKAELINHPQLVCPADLKNVPTADQPLAGQDLADYVARISLEIAGLLGLEKK